ncbi:TonB-dependent receptor [Asticcacaulis sp. SL142]|uniref:TonB-dependent receptor family protein n=1 Tax=Asticcacaulis sp. SL142 TaxID=2995155 RepID=UPI00226D14BC|nr:TonB-dependent receptor [Asticcacaulis sp. SL142]WAC48930.1 TonB-dependent receptor [Asticcacaulis sp. SL142]
MTKLSCALLTSASLLALPVYTHAAEAETDIPTVIVTANASSEDPSVVKTTREKLARTPGAVSVVANETYSNSYAMGLFDTLKNVSGVFAQKKFGEDSRFSIRGSGIGNNTHNRGTWLSVDGIPLNQADGSGDFQEIDPLSARYIEVYKGGNALRFGGSQLGGAVNYVTPTGYDAGYRSLLRVEGGSFGTARAHVAYADVIGDYDLYLATTVLRADGWRDNADQEAKRLTLNLGRRFGDNRSVRFIFQGNDLDQRISGALSQTEALTTPEMTNAPNYAAVKYGRNVKSARGTLQTDWQINEDWRFEGGVYAAWKHLIHPISIHIDQQSQNYGAFGRFDGKGEIGGKAYDLFIGANYRKGLVDSHTTTNVLGSPGMVIGEAVQNSESWDVFAEGRLFVTDQLALITGGSYGWTKRDYINHLNIANNADKDFDWFAPRIGFMWQNETGHQVFANITKSVEAPNYGALVQSPLPQFVNVQPQEAVTAEIGTRGRSAHFVWDASIYRAEIDGEMLTYIPVDAGLPAATFNAQNTIHQGLETALDWKIGTIGGWSTVLRQTYTWSDFKFDGDKVYSDNQLPVVPEHYYRGEMSFSHGNGWRVAPSVEWVPEDVWVDFANTTKAPSYTVWNLSVSKRLSPSIEIYVDARNLGDERYISSVNSVTDFTKVAASARRVFWPGEGRAVIVGIKLMSR